MRGGLGRDRLNGGKGAGDLIGAGGGRDRINARDGGRDIVRCGTGRDRARVDSKDSVADSCERASVEPS